MEVGWGVVGEWVIEPKNIVIYLSSVLSCITLGLFTPCPCYSCRWFFIPMVYLNLSYCHLILQERTLCSPSGCNRNADSSLLSINPPLPYVHKKVPASNTVDSSSTCTSLAHIYSFWLPKVSPPEGELHLTPTTPEAGEQHSNYCQIS